VKVSNSVLEVIGMSVTNEDIHVISACKSPRRVAR